MAALKQHTASKVKARVMQGKDAKGNELTFAELEPDIKRLREYAQTLSEGGGAKLNKLLDDRVQELNPEATTADPSEAPEAPKAKTDRQKRDDQLEHCKKMVKGKLLTPNTYSKVRKEFLDQKRAPTKDKNGKVYDGSELSDADMQDHAYRLLIYASTMKHACRRAQLEKEVWEKLQDRRFSKIAQDYHASKNTFKATALSTAKHMYC